MKDYEEKSILDVEIDGDENNDAEKATAGGAIGGAAVGAAAGSLAGPAGTVLGAAVGGLVGAVASGAAVSEIDEEQHTDPVTGLRDDEERHIMTEADMHPHTPVDKVTLEPGPHGIDGDPERDPQKGGLAGGVGGAVIGGIAGAAAGPVGVIAGSIAGATLGTAAGAAATKEVNKHDDDDTVTGIHTPDHKDENDQALEDAIRAAEGRPLKPLDED
ncbi:MAG: hypothetical protein KF812_01540 [Fimbriimonadaceae bacterium]|nr:hypothetical protein [Fimbriimonadaceae bacterium]